MIRMILYIIFLFNASEIYSQVLPFRDDNGSIIGYYDYDTLQLAEHSKLWTEDHSCTFSGYDCVTTKQRHRKAVEGELVGIYLEMYIYDYDSCSNIQREVYNLWNLSFDSLIKTEIKEYKVECK